MAPRRRARLDVPPVKFGGWRSSVPVIGILLACRHSIPTPALVACSVIPPASATPPSWSHIDDLAGKYDLTLVNTGGEYGDSVGRGVLELRANDNARRYIRARPDSARIVGERPLAGSFQIRPGAPWYNQPDQASRSHTHPGVGLMDQLLMIGGIDVTDGSGEFLNITAVSPDGFWGRWTWNGGIAAVYDTRLKRALKPPTGHFCASRRPKL